MLNETTRRVRNMFKHSDSWQFGYDEGYMVGLQEGQDFGKRVAYNTTLTSEVTGLLNRYGHLQVKLLNKHASKDEMQRAFTNFLNTELDRFKMEIQDR